MNKDIIVQKIQGYKNEFLILGMSQKPQVISSDEIMKSISNLYSQIQLQRKILDKMNELNNQSVQEVKQ